MENILVCIFNDAIFQAQGNSFTIRQFPQSFLFVPLAASRLHGNAERLFTKVHAYENDLVFRNVFLLAVGFLIVFLHDHFNRFVFFPPFSVIFVTHTDQAFAKLLQPLFRSWLPRGQLSVL